MLVYSLQEGEFEKKLAACTTDEERMSLTDAYNEEMRQEKARLEAERQKKRDELQARLRARAGKGPKQQKDKVELTGTDLLAAADAEAKAQAAMNASKRAQAQRRLAERRAKLLAKQKADLIAAGVSEEAAEKAIGDIKAADDEADSHRENLEKELEDDELSVADSKRRALEASMAAASTDEERAALEAAFKADMVGETARLDMERKRKREELNKRLAARKAKVTEEVSVSAPACVHPQRRTPPSRRSGLCHM